MRNKIFKKMLLIGLVGMLLIGMMPSAVAYQDSLKVIVTVEDKTYNVGDVVNITVHVFDKGEYVSADDVNVTAGYDPVTYTPRYVEVTQTSTGVYEGTYTIKPTDTYLYISATAEKGTDSDSGYVYISIGETEEYGVIDVTVKLDDPFDYYSQPGDSVGIIVTVKDEDVNVNADTLDLTVNDEPLNYTNASTGIYKATYNIPSNLTGGKSFDVMASASKDSKYGSDSKDFYVIFYVVWYHNITLTNTSSTFELYVADLNGNAVSGATINISYDNDSNYATSDVYMEEITDSNGKTTFSISYTEQSYSLEIKGNASYAGKTQEFSRYLYVPTTGEVGQPQSEGFDVIYIGEYGSYSAGEDVIRQYKAYNDGVALANKEIYYYITEGFSASAIIKHDAVITDSNGVFTLTFTAPDGDIAIHFETGTPKEPEDYGYDQDDNLTYDADYDYMHTGMFEYPDILLNDTDISISISTLIVGGSTTITVTALNVPSDAVLMAGAFPWSMDVISIYWGLTADWQCWSHDDVALLTKTNNEYTGEIIIPEFMPADIDYTVIAGWTDEVTWESHFNHVILKPGESSETDADGDGIPDSLDPDDDNDGYSDEIEISEGTNLLDATSTPLDTDGDYIPDSTDTDDDNDGYPDTTDAFPLNANEWIDTDNDGIGNNADTDDDNDGVSDADDYYPLDSSKWKKPEEKQKGFIPGFEILGIISAIGICLILIRRKRK